MNRFPSITVVCLGLLASLACQQAFSQQRPQAGRVLTSGEYFITQTWSQETNYPRRYLVQVPRHNAGQKLPVFISLHGNGGNAFGAMRGTSQRMRRLSARFITVFPEGYDRSWNIVTERSKADDRAFLEAIITSLASHKNVAADNYSIMGNSNGSALANQLAIECRLPNIRSYITAVSPLNAFQHDGTNFRSKGANNEYQEVAKPMTGKRMLNISGTHDPLIPYYGGPSRAIPAKQGKLSFVSAERSTFLWAQQMGYTGEQLEQPTSKDGPLEFFRYLDGDVVHIKANGQRHNAAGAVSEQVLLDFLE